MNFLKKTISFFVTFAIVAGMTFSVQADEIQWKEIYNAPQSHDGKRTNLYIGDITFEPGDIYRFTWEGTWYHGGIGGANVYVADDDSKVELFWRDGAKNGKINGNISMTATEQNPKPFKFVMIFDYTSDSPVGYVDVYDIDKETIAGTITVNLSGIDSIKKIYHQIWNDGNFDFERPRSGNCLMEADSSRFAIPSDLEWETVCTEKGKTREQASTATDVYHDLFEGEISSDSSYKLVWRTDFYKGGGVNNGNFVIEDEDGSVTLFSKGKDNNKFGDGIEFGTLEDTGNPDSVVIEIELNFSNDTANINFYDDKNCTKLLGQKTADIAALDGINKIYYYVPDKGVDIFSRPQNSTLEILKGKIVPKVRNVILTSEGRKITLYGEGAIDLSKSVIDPVFEKISIDINCDIDIALAENAITLTAEGSDENMLSGYSQKNFVVTADISGEIMEETVYTLTVDTSVFNSDLVVSPYTLSFKTGRKKMEGQISNARIENGTLVVDIAFVNKADLPKDWCFVVNCFDERGCLIWCGVYEDGEAVSGNLNTTAEISIPGGNLPEGTAKVKAYLWNSLALAEIYSDGVEILN